MQFPSKSNAQSRPSLILPCRRAHRLTLLTGLVMSLYACGGGGGGGNDNPAVPAPAPTAQSYSSVYFTDASSSVAFIDSAPDGTGVVGYRNASGSLKHADYLAKNKTTYHFDWLSDIYVTVKFDGLTIGMDLSQQPVTYSITGPDGSVLTGQLSNKKSFVKSDLLMQECVTNHRVQDEDESTRPIFQEMVDFKCGIAAKVMATATLAADAAADVIDAGAGLLQLLGNAGSASLVKGKEFFASNELQDTFKRSESTPRQEMAGSVQVIRTPASMNGQGFVDLTPQETAALIGDVRRPTGNAPAGNVVDWTQVKPLGASVAPSPSPAPTPAPSPAPSPTPPPAPAPAPMPSFPHSGSYSVSGGDVTVTFIVDASGNIGRCSAGVLVTCSGKVENDGSFSFSGSDGDGTNATLTGRIDSSGKVTGRYIGTSEGESIGGTFTGARGGGVDSSGTGMPAGCAALAGTWKSVDFPGDSWSFTGTNVTITDDLSSNVGVGAISVIQSTLLSCSDTVFVARPTRKTYTNPHWPSDSYDWGPGEGGGRTNWDTFANSYKLNGSSITINDLLYSR